MAGESAVTPNRSALLKFAREINRDKDDKSGIDKGDASLAELASLPGWGTLKEFIERRREALRPKFDFGDENSDDDIFKSYGMRSVVYDIVSGQLDLIIQKVEDAKKTVTEQRDKASSKE